MTTSGTYNNFLAEGDMVLEAFDRCGIRPSEITRERMASCKRSFNLEMQTWSIKGGVNLWAVELYSITLAQGQSTYALPANVVSVLDVYINDGSSDRYMTPMSRTDYAMQSNKTSQSPPTTYWFNRQTPAAQMVLWQVPDGGTYTLNMYVMRQLQDVNLLGNETADIPYRFQDALVACVAKRLALKFAAAKFALLKTEAQEAFELANIDDREHVDLDLTPVLNNYYRGT